ncbi:hypothetical protein [Salisediminibacterium halotolerans]|nr:hypothetical protein [Salisediminibacterium haloalkalitolerans]
MLFMVWWNQSQVLKGTDDDALFGFFPRASARMLGHPPSLNRVFS